MYTFTVYTCSNICVQPVCDTANDDYTRHIVQHQKKLKTTAKNWGKSFRMHMNGKIHLYFNQSNEGNRLPHLPNTNKKPLLVAFICFQLFQRIVGSKVQWIEVWHIFPVWLKASDIYHVVLLLHKAIVPLPQTRLHTSTPGHLPAAPMEQCAVNLGT